MKQTLRSARTWPPINTLAAVPLRFIFRERAPEIVVRHLHRVGVITQRLPNHARLRLRSDGDDWIANEVFWRGAFGYEPEMAREFFGRAANASVVIDVGAFIGYYTVLAALANPRARVYALEPMSRTAVRLRHNVKLNELRNVTVLDVAAASTTGTSALWQLSHGMPSSVSLSRAFMATVPGATAKDVPTVRLDDLVDAEGIEHVDLIKLDTESTEPDILAGAPKLLDRDRPAIFCEVLPGFDVEARLTSILGPLGYTYFALTRSGRERREHIVADPSTPNYLFLPDGEPTT